MLKCFTQKIDKSIEVTPNDLSNSQNLIQSYNKKSNSIEFINQPNIQIFYPLLFNYNNIEINYPGIDGCGYVLMSNGNYKQVFNLKKGDQVISFDYNNNIIQTKIKYIIKTKINNSIMLFNINNIIMSANHLIQYNNLDWIYPNTILNLYGSNIDYLYNIVLENGCGVLVNNLKIITLGSNHFDDRYLNYYFSKTFINDISKFDKNNDGYIILDNPFIQT
jgi:hypothetical protein